MVHLHHFQHGSSVPDANGIYDYCELYQDENLLAKNLASLPMFNSTDAKLIGIIFDPSCNDCTE